MVDFKALKASSGDLTRLANEIEKMNKPQTFADNDETYWRPTLDKAGNGYARIRFLDAPAVDGDDAMPYVRYYNHSFQGPSGKWYIENNRGTLGRGVKDPVSEYNARLYKAGEKDKAQLTKRNTRFVSNIYVIEDPAAPENEGKVFRFRYGKRIYRKIEEAFDPYHDEDGNEIIGTHNLNKVNPFDFWRGSDFKLRVKTVRSGSKSFPNYDDSSFIKNQDGQVVESALFDGDDAQIKKVWESEYSLKELIAEDKFKSYDELKAKLYEVLELEDDDNVVIVNKTTGTVPNKTTTTKPKKTLEDLKDTVVPVEEADDDVFVDDGNPDDLLSTFQKLAAK